jgi:hypothetical protein
MPQIQRNSGLTSNDLVTNTKLHNLVDTAVVTKELITAQTALSSSESGAFLLAYSVANDALRKITTETLLSSLQFDNIILGTDAGTTTVRGILNVENENAGWHQHFKVDPNLLSLAPIVSIRGGLSVTNGLEAGGELGSLTQFYTGTIELGGRIKITDKKVDGLADQYGLHYDVNFGVNMGGGDDSVNVKFDTNSTVEFHGDNRFVNTVIKLGEKPEDPEDEVTVDLSIINKGVYDLDYTVVPQYVWATSFGDVRRVPADVPTVGKLAIDDTFVVPANEIWLVQYDGGLSDGTDDPYTIVWLLDNVVSKTYQFPSVNMSGGYIGHFFKLIGGEDGTTYNVKVRMAVNSGSGGDSFTIFSSTNTNPQDWHWCQKSLRTVTKIRV